MCKLGRTGGREIQRAKLRISLLSPLRQTPLNVQLIACIVSGSVCNAGCTIALHSGARNYDEFRIYAARSLLCHKHCSVLRRLGSSFSSLLQLQMNFTDGARRQDAPAGAEPEPRWVWG